MGFMPIETSKVITETYKRYLRTIFSIGNDIYEKQFMDQINCHTELAVGPYLDVTDSFKKGKSISGLIEEGVLSPGFAELHIDLERSLHLHQEQAIRKVLSGKNVVVSTGTGSGKTESFLIPIADHLMRQEAAGQLRPGVRALLIYPMNALANDQVERLRKLFRGSAITYGVYTGQTENRYDNALAVYKELNNDAEPQPNELISRSQMKKTPPHILITNYAMLEYLMLRPDDNVFFDGEFAGEWKYIVMDEVHVYSGSTGIEVSMLLRRLKATLTVNDVQFVLTSATLGSDKDNKDVARFATDLCDRSFFPSDVVRATRMKIEPNRELVRISISFYTEIAEMFASGFSDEVILSRVQQELPRSTARMNLKEALYDVILHDERYWEIRKILQIPLEVSQAAEKAGLSEKELADFVFTASKCVMDGAKLFDARYHMFLRATEGAFVTLAPSRKLFLTRKDTHIEPDGMEYKVFEIAICTKCHSIYLIGANDDNGHFSQSRGFDDTRQREAFLLSDSISDTDEEQSLSKNAMEAEQYKICPKCGMVRKASLAGKSRCEHDLSEYVDVVRVKSSNEKAGITKCVACESTNPYGILRPFFSGQEAVTSVIGTSLFEELPSSKYVLIPDKKEDDSGFGISDDHPQTEIIHLAKQFIAFSDNRQSAAYFASYFDQTYKSLLYRRIVFKALSDPHIHDRVSLNTFVQFITHFFESDQIECDTENAEREAWKATLQEIVSYTGEQSLYNKGLLGFAIDSTGVSGVTKYHLSTEEMTTLYNVLLLSLISDGAIYTGYPLVAADKDFYIFGGFDYSYNFCSANDTAHVHSFVPSSSDGRKNKRLDYLERVLKKKGFENSREEYVNILSAIFNNMRGQTLNQLVSENGRYRVNAEKVTISKTSQWFFCPKCQHLTIYNLDGVCPTYQCSGTLQPVDPEILFQDDHYYHLYHEMEIRSLRIVEHTAQLDKKTASSYQKKFVRKEIDVLSCSTTFEMGVDVGTLETVFMRNMPPSPSNYTQRAGRAGRSLDSAAYALTFCNRSNHDLTFFHRPVSMIRGIIPPPKFTIENEKIAIRHIFATAFSFFWKQYPKYFEDAATLLDDKEAGDNGYQLLRAYLQGKPDALRDFLMLVLPPNLAAHFDIENFGWLDLLLRSEGNEPGALTRASEDYKYEVGRITEEIDQIRASKDDSIQYLIKNLDDRRKNFKKEYILSFLSRKGVLPKYGFPVDTVEMSVFDRNAKVSLGLQLQRDLSMAITEYAPGSQIVANGYLLTSRYIRRIPGISWRSYDYITCNHCKTLNIDSHVEMTSLSHLNECLQCGEALDPEKRETFIIPEFGFEADGNHIDRPKLVKPDRAYRGETAYVGFREDLEKNTIQIGSNALELYISQGDEMAVMNKSKYFVCETCGFTVQDDKFYGRTKKKLHEKATGYRCKDSVLKRYSLGYRFKTDVIQIRFVSNEISSWEIGLSIMYGIQRGVCDYLCIEQREIDGCLQFFKNPVTGSGNYAVILYDKTPGGAGYVKRLNDQAVMEGVLERTLDLMERCTCGGEKKDSSCYSCLRSYFNQRNHDILKRSYVIDFLNKVFTKA